MKKSTYLCIGGALDGQAVELTPEQEQQEYVQLSHQPQMPAGELESISAQDVETSILVYRVWDFVFVDEYHQEHKFCVLYHKDLNDVQAFHKLFQGYNP